MFQKGEVKKSLIGCFEIFLLMRVGASRFGTTYDEAIRSFIIPGFLFPLSFFMVYFFPIPDMGSVSENTIIMLYSMRIAFSWVIYFGIVQWVLKRVDRTENFYRFVTATNWLTIPATVIYLPVLLGVMSGAYSVDQLYAFTMFLTAYTYVFTAFMAVHVLIIPWEMAGFIVFLAIAIDDMTLTFMEWIGRAVGSA